ncbi:helix-turn-helix domain-containing protein [Bacteroides thetaiotaomicron]|nr:helix-turn-helix domain-containing protein [Bacteroides thetaiotaomicron]
MKKRALLLQNDRQLSATEIASRCGFSSLSLLSRNFKQHFNITIREFRSQE